MKIWCASGACRNKDGELVEIGAGLGAVLVAVVDDGGRGEAEQQHCQPEC